MKKIIIFVILLFVISLQARWVEVNPRTDLQLYECAQEDPSEAEITFNLDGFELKEMVYGKMKYSQISHEDCGRLLETGMPDFPIFSQALVIPDEGVSSLEIISYQKIEFDNIIIYPQEELQYEHEIPQDNFSINQSFYNSQNVYPESFVWMGDPAIMRDVRLLPVTFCPFQFDAAQNKLYVYTSINIRIHTTGRGGKNILQGRGKRSRAFEEMYRSSTLNYDLLPQRDEYQVPTILFICPDDDDVLENLDYLTTWKRQKGFNVVVATTAETGNTNVSIKNYIQNAYDNWLHPPEYINFMGDGSGSYTIPTWFSSGGFSGEGDHPYSQLEGDDILADVILGRMTFSSISSLQTVINKILNYEKVPYMGSTSWYNRGLLVGDPTSSGYSCVAFAKGVKELMLDFPGNYWSDANFEEVYEYPFAGSMNDAVTMGVNVFAYRGFGGTSGWQSGNTYNGYKMPFLVMPTCDANDWCYGMGNVENFYLMGSSTMPNGGIGGMGTATPGTHTPFNNAIAIGVWGGIFRDNIYTMGGAVTKGKYYLWLTFPQFSSSYVTQFSHWNTLMGDASLEIWTRLPQNLSLVYNSFIPEGSNYYQCVVNDSIGVPAEGAWVTLYGENGDFTATEFCDSNGSAILDISSASAGEYTLTVTKHDHIPVIETVTIAQADQFVEITDYDVDDSAGNNNGLVNPGESIDLTFTLENLGDMDVEDVNVNISSSNELVTVNNSEVNFGDIAAGESVTGTTAFELDFANQLLGWMEVKIDVIITDADDNQWNTWLMLLIVAPNLYASDYTIAGDGVIDPGETENIHFTLQNTGIIPSGDITALLTCNNPRITISDSLGSFNPVDPGETVNNAADRFLITASSAILPGTHIPFHLHLTDTFGYDNVTTINVAIGEPQVTDPYGPDEYGYWVYDNEDTAYDKCPEYNWIEIDPSYGGDGNLVSWETGGYMGTGGDTGTFSNIDLPPTFNLVFYGEEYDDLCISTNGWVAPGHHESGNFMNYQIPGPQGPSPMIAVFWDDLALGGGNVYWYYDDDLHYFIVQWSRIQNGDTWSDETFQVIIYDPIYYPTTTGDSEIKMQYMVATNNNSGSYPSNHGQYATVGIENHDSTIGLQYTFNNTYPEACKILQNQTALLFTPPPIPPAGPFLNISSFSALAGDDDFIEAGENALISIELENLGAESAYNIEAQIFEEDPYISINDSEESLAELPAGEFADLQNAFDIQVSENVPDYYIFYLEVLITCDDNSWNWMLPFTAYKANTFEVDQDSVYFELQPMQTGTHQFVLTNIGDVPVNYYLRIDEVVPPARDISGSYMTIDTDSFTPGEETTWSFSVNNAGVDNEWINNVWLDFPMGVNILSASDIIGGSGGALAWDGTTGFGQEVNWFGESANGWGYIHTAETGYWETDVQLSTEFASDLTIGWTIGGDGYGTEPHIVNGEFILLYPLRWMNLDTSGGTLNVNQSQTITINFDSSDIEPGMYYGDIIITSDSWDTQTVKVALNVYTVDEENQLIPQNTHLEANYPNPFNPQTDIMFQLADEEDISLKIYNSRGQLIKTLAEGLYPAGSHSLAWQGCDQNGKPVSSGIYFYRLKTASYDQVRKMLLLK